MLNISDERKKQVK